jgi:hypothetical protein
MLSQHYHARAWAKMTQIAGKFLHGISQILSLVKLPFNHSKFDYIQFSPAECPLTDSNLPQPADSV